MYGDGSVSSSHLVACQIIPINDDPTISILNCYRRLTEFILSNSLTNTRYELSVHKGIWDLPDSSSTYSLHQSGNQFTDYWQRSLSLASSSTLNTSAESPFCNPSQTQPNKVKEQSCEGEHNFAESTVLSQSNVKAEDLTVEVYLPKNNLRVKNSSVTIIKPLANTCGYNPCSSHVNSLSSQMRCRHHHHLQNVCNSSSYGCQDNSACLKHFPSQYMQTAESHQVENGTWDEFPFSESLSEFIARLENLEEERFNFNVKENKFCVSKKKEQFYEGHFKTTDDFIKTPGRLFARCSQKIEAPTKIITPYSLGDTGSNAVASRDACEIFQSDNPASEEALASSASEGIQEPVQKSFMHDFLAKDSIVSVASSVYPSVSSRHKTCSRMNESAPYIITHGERNLQKSNFSHPIAKKINTHVLSVEKYSLSHSKEARDVDNERTLENISPLRSNHLVPITATPGNYNASADLFDVAEGILEETLQSKHKRSLKRRHGPPSWDSPCTDVTVQINSQFQASYLQGVHGNGTIHDLFSCLQSTPIRRPLSESSVLTGNDCIISDPRDPILSRRSSHLLKKFLLKKIKPSLRSSSNMFCTISDNFHLYSPVSSFFSETSRRQVLQKRETLVTRSGKKILEDKENHSITRCNGRSSEDGGDSSIVTRHEMDQSEMTSPWMSPLHLFTAEKPLPGDWSPELFNNSDIFKQSDTIQRRLF